MRFDRESWRKLYISESAEHRLLPLFTRGLRDYLLRFSSEDGTLLAQTFDPASDLALALNVRGQERVKLKSAVKDLLRIGYLCHEGGRLWIRRFAEAQGAQTPGAKRNAAYKKRKSENAQPNRASPVTLGGDAEEENEVTLGGDAGGDVTPDETRRDETPPDESDGAPTFNERCSAKVRDPFGASFDDDVPLWPETTAIDEAFVETWGRSDMPRHGGDPRAVAIVGRGAEGYTVEQLVAAVRGSKFAKHIAGNREFQTLTTILRDSAQVDKFAALLEQNPTEDPNAPEVWDP